MTGTQQAILDLLRIRERNQQWLADKLGISGAHLTRLLNGERVWTKDLREKTAIILDTPAWLIFDNDRVPCREG